jgi:exosortase family protein XrtM
MGSEGSSAGGMLRLKLFIKSNRREIRFFLLFILYFIIGQSLLYFSRSHTIDVLVNHNARMSSRIINTLTPEEKSFNKGTRILGSQNFSINVEEGCDGIESMLLIVAAIWAFQMGVKYRVFGSITGICIIYFFNLARIIVLYYTLKYRPGMFDVMHIYIGQIVIIFIGVLFFIAWISKFSKTNEKTG